MSTVRKASKAHLESTQAQTEHELKAEHERLRAIEEAQCERMAQQIEQKDLLIAGYQRENRELRERIERSESTAHAQGGASKRQTNDADQTAQLEAALAQRDATIRALRDQLARVQHGLPPTAPDGAPALKPSQSMPAVPSTPGGKGQAAGARSASRGKK